MKQVKRVFKKIGLLKSKNATEDSIKRSIFDHRFYKDITDARSQHFKSMSLPLSGKSVIDVGCGIGHFSEMLAEQCGDVFCIDGRAENIKNLRELYPSRKCAVVDVETPDILMHGTFDVVFCYGLLYHIMDPMGFIKNVSKICHEIMVLETCIMDSKEPMVQLVSEDPENETQALHSTGCRPSTSYVNACLKLSGFEFIYHPVSLPMHPQFDYKLKNDYSYIKQGHLIRNIFIASRNEIVSPMLRLV